MSISKPTFVLVPGVAHTPVHTRILAESLNARGYQTEAISHPTIGPLAGTAPPNADAANLRRTLEQLVQSQQKDVILLCHAYGGMVGSQCVNGLERSARAKAGRQGGIVKVIFLSALLPQEGESMLQIFGEVEITPRPWMDMDVSHIISKTRC
jgi:alpha-beta hydrolase superfamily lysophospholipase